MIQLEVGKSYRVRNPEWVSRSSRIVRIIKMIDLDDNGFEFFGDDDYTYRGNGSFRPGQQESDFDLVEEVKQ